MTARQTESPAMRTPLLAIHEAAGAQLIDFAGWQMPVRYGSDLAEHVAVRERAGLFDLSHMAELRVRGAEAAAFLDHALAGRLSAIEPWQAKYSLLLAEQGGIIDDVIVYRIGGAIDAEAEFLVVANAANRHAALDALTARIAGFDATIVDETEDTALIAVQGPAALAVVERDRARVRAARRAALLPQPARRLRGRGRARRAAPATPARTASSCTSPRTPPRTSGAPSCSPARRTGSRSAGSPRATRSGSRRACRSTATSCRSTRCPRKWGSAASSR